MRQVCTDKYRQGRGPGCGKIFDDVDRSTLCPHAELGKAPGRLHRLDGEHDLGAHIAAGTVEGGTAPDCPRCSSSTGHENRGEPLGQPNRPDHTLGGE